MLSSQDRGGLEVCIHLNTRFYGVDPFDPRRTMTSSRKLGGVAYPLFIRLYVRGEGFALE